jgi:hypothetical protein
MAEQLKEAAREQDRSVSAVIRQALEAELRREAEGRHRDQGRQLGRDRRIRGAEGPLEFPVGSRCRARRRRHGPLRVFRHRPTRHRPTLVRQKDLRVRPQHPPKIRRRSTSTGSRFADDPGSLASWSSWCRFGADDAGIFVGSIHSHPGIDRHRELSATDIRAASWNAEKRPLGDSWQAVPVRASDSRRGMVGRDAGRRLGRPRLGLPLGLPRPLDCQATRPRAERSRVNR